ncbi:MafI family immunity protein [Microcystis sp. LEGE 00066]|uniref:MafI family immunity protein n=1 Tax=Microcystis TaxID=1125 RepID=UPI0002AC3D26|nr:hypothetical protein C789_5433 [Microcystis aeruginosa FACHB-905 = DIANCHI905]MBE9264592.1 MafI family immunity protein [Microcystis sp. LEGE 00066]
MSDYKLIKSKLNEVILLTNEVMQETQIEFVRSYIDAVKWRLAIETLCDILYEDELPIWLFSTLCDNFCL